MAAPTPLPEEPTLRDIALSLRELHGCVHEQHAEAMDANAQTLQQLREHRHDSRNNAQKLDTRLSKAEGQLDILSRVVGAPPVRPNGEPAAKVKTSLLALEPWKAALGTVAAVAAATGGYKIIVAAATAFHHAMLGAAGG